MFVKVLEGSVEAYPYSRKDFLRDFPNVSVPLDLSIADLAEFGVFPVTAVAKPAPAPGKIVVETLPIEVGGVWTQVWLERSTTPVELAERKTARAAEVLLLLGEKIEASALATALDADDLEIIETMSKLAASTLSYLLASSSTSFRTNIAACRTNAKTLLAAIRQASTLAILEAIDIQAGWPNV